MVPVLRVHEDGDRLAGHEAGRVLPPHLVDDTSGVTLGTGHGQPEVQFGEFAVVGGAAKRSDVLDAGPALESVPFELAVGAAGPFGRDSR